jgi:hypothetical protein
MACLPRDLPVSGGETRNKVEIHNLLFLVPLADYFVCTARNAGPVPAVCLLRVCLQVPASKAMTGGRAAFDYKLMPKGREAREEREGAAASQRQRQAAGTGERERERKEKERKESRIRNSNDQAVCVWTS